MKKKLLILSVALFVLLVSAEAYNNSLITLSMDEIKSGEVSYTGVGGGPRHELSYSELKEFVDFFNSCNIKKKQTAEKFPEIILQFLTLLICPCSCKMTETFIIWHFGMAKYM